MENVIGFIEFVDTPKDARVYGCKGFGVDYDNFYKWVYSTSYKCVTENFPWDYFTFTDPNDEKEFVSRYESSITQMKTDF